MDIKINIKVGIWNFICVVECDVHTYKCLSVHIYMMYECMYVMYDWIHEKIDHASS